jgi:hypothetical protein
MALGTTRTRGVRLPELFGPYARTSRTTPWSGGPASPIS